MNDNTERPAHDLFAPALAHLCTEPTDANDYPTNDRPRRQASRLKYANTSHSRHVDAFTDWTLRCIDELVAENRDPPLVVPLTVTFALRSTRPDRVLSEYERFYARLCRLLITNPDRPSKRHLLPFALAFRDDPSTRPDKHRDRPTAFAIFSNHPSVAPHVHSLIVIHPNLADRFLTTVDALEATWRQIPVRTANPIPSALRCLSRPIDEPMYANRTLHADVPFALRVRELMRLDLVGNGSVIRSQIRNVIDYSSKLGRRRDVADDVDLFTVLPSASTALVQPIVQTDQSGHRVAPSSSAAHK